MKRVDPLSGVVTFLTLAELGSFAATAKALGFSPATVSNQIADLEQRLAVRLVHRDTRRVTLSEAGVAYRAEMSGVLEQAQRAELAATAVRDDLGGCLRITAPLGAARRLLKTTIDSFMLQNPKVSIDLHQSVEIMNLVEGRFDLAIRSRRTVESNWVTRQIAVCRVIAAASPQYLARRGAPQEPKDIAGHDCISFRHISFGRVWSLRQGDRIERVEITHPRFQCNDSVTMLQWAVDGYGLVLLPDFILGDVLEEGKLVEILPDWQAPPIEMYAVYPGNKHITARVKLFVDALIEANRV